MADVIMSFLVNLVLELILRPIGMLTIQAVTLGRGRFEAPVIAGSGPLVRRDGRDIVPVPAAAPVAGFLVIVLMVLVLVTIF